MPSTANNKTLLTIPAKPTYPLWGTSLGTSMVSSLDPILESIFLFLRGLGVGKMPGGPSSAQQPSTSTLLQYKADNAPRLL